MVGTVVIIIVLALFPVLVLMSGAPAAAIIGFFLKSDRDDAYAGTEYLTLANGPAPAASDDDADAE